MLVGDDPWGKNIDMVSLLLGATSDTRGESRLSFFILKLPCHFTLRKQNLYRFPILGPVLGCLALRDSLMNLGLLLA